MENTALIRVKNVTPEIDLIKEYQKDPKFQEKYNEITNKYKGKLIFLAMDHLFFPITIKNKLVAYKRFLSSNIERAKKVVFLLIIRSSSNEEKYEQKSTDRPARRISGGGFFCRPERGFSSVRLRECGAP